MKRFSTEFIGLLGATVLMGAASTCLAGGPPPPPPGIDSLPPGIEAEDCNDGGGGGTCLYGGDRFPDTVFALAEHSTANQATCASGGFPTPSNTISGMRVHFVTRTSGLARVTFCGTLDAQSDPGNLYLAATIDGQLDKCLTIRGVNPWGNDEDDSDGPTCWEWICEVENENCGKSPNSTCWTEHDVAAVCSSSSDGTLKINDRNLFVDYTQNHTN